MISTSPWPSPPEGGEGTKRIRFESVNGRRIVIFRNVMMGLLFFGALFGLLGCASSPPAKPHDACAIYSEKGGFFDNWQRYTRNASREFGIPESVILATIWQESKFDAKARPPRTKLLGFIPWKRPSTAYGYAQALDGTWDQFLKSTGTSRLARRSNYKHAARFVAWYHDQSHRINGIARHDAFNLYLAYHEGHGGFRRGTYRNKAWLINVAHRVQEMAHTFERQLARC